MPTWKLTLSLAFATSKVSKAFGSSKKKFQTISSFTETSSCVLIIQDILEHWALHPDGAQGNAKDWPPASQMIKKPKIRIRYQAQQAILVRENRKHIDMTREMSISTQLNFFCSSIVFLVHDFISHNPRHTELQAAIRSIKIAGSF